MLDVIFRSCVSCMAVHQPERGRVTGTDKLEVTRRCYRSLVASLTRLPADSWRLWIIDDSVGADRQWWADAGLWVPDHFRELRGQGNLASLAACYALADLQCHDLIYFVEDDYLHVPEAMEEAVTVAENARIGHLRSGAFLCDYPNAYLPQAPIHALIGHGRYRHWIRVRQTTGSFLIHAEQFKAHRAFFAKFAETAIEAGSVNEVWKSVPCLSPIPTLTWHLQIPETISPVLDWRPTWEAYK